ncbi:MAG: alpha/beta hydrolase [Actinomycetaceae bacterium]|nr:alpha/beta hydrolase [Actinomycetaceae bacterium]
MKAELIKHLADDPKASVLILHGYAEHQGRYAHVVKYLVEGGFDVYTYDQYGHGTAPGPRAKVDVGQLIKDHLEAREQLRSIMRTKELFLFGHSMGGVITAASNLIRPAGVTGVVLSGPAFDGAGGMDPEIVRKVAKAALKFPKGLPTAELDPNAVSHDPQVVEDYKNDPLNYTGRVPAITAATMMLQGLETLDRADKWKNPLVIFHGSDDTLAMPRASWEFADKARQNGAPVEMIEVPGARHEVFNEPHVNRMLMETMNMWMLGVLRDEAMKTLD